MFAGFSNMMVTGNFRKGHFVKMKEQRPKGNGSLAELDNSPVEREEKD